MTPKLPSAIQTARFGEPSGLVGWGGMDSAAVAWDASTTEPSMIADKSTSHAVIVDASPWKVQIRS